MDITTSSQTIKSTFTLLRVTFGLMPIAAGFDKFTNLLTDWQQYLHPGIAGMLPITVGTFMMIVGIIEIAAGLLVLIRPAIGALIVSAWLSLISVTLIASGNYYDIAVRDLVMSIAAFALARMARIAM